MVTKKKIVPGIIIVYITSIFSVALSPITAFVLVSPALAIMDSASSSSFSSPLPTISIIPFAPSTIGQEGKEGDFTTQAALGSITARPTNNIVNTKSFYDIVFVTAKAGAIKHIQVTFPAGTTVPTTASFNEAEGIGKGTISEVSGQTITYTVNSAASIPAGTKIRLEFANINNPLNPSTDYKVTVTTRNTDNAIIDGPTQSSAYIVKQIGPNAIANNAITAPKIADRAITSTKPAESFMKRVTVLDDAAGHAVGWNPDGAKNVFGISEPAALSADTTFVDAITLTSGAISCFAGFNNPGQIFFVCQTPPIDGSPLHYVITNTPAHVVQ